MFYSSPYLYVSVTKGYVSVMCQVRVFLGGCQTSAENIIRTCPTRATGVYIIQGYRPIYVFLRVLTCFARVFTCQSKFPSPQERFEACQQESGGGNAKNRIFAPQNLSS